MNLKQTAKFMAFWCTLLAFVDFVSGDIYGVYFMIAVVISSLILIKIL